MVYADRIIANIGMYVLFVRHSIVTTERILLKFDTWVEIVPEQDTGYFSSPDPTAPNEGLEQDCWYYLVRKSNYFLTDLRVTSVIQTKYEKKDRH